MSDEPILTNGWNPLIAGCPRCSDAEALRARVAALEEALRELLNDSQHNHHICGDENCIVSAARKALEPGR